MQLGKFSMAHVRTLLAAEIPFAHTGSRQLSAHERLKGIDMKQPITHSTPIAHVTSVGQGPQSAGQLAQFSSVSHLPLPQ
jgi:hypothetical protein